MTVAIVFAKTGFFLSVNESLLIPYLPWTDDERTAYTTRQMILLNENSLLTSFDLLMLVFYQRLELLKLGETVYIFLVKL